MFSNLKISVLDPLYHLSSLAKWQGRELKIDGIWKLLCNFPVKYTARVVSSGFKFFRSKYNN